MEALVERTLGHLHGLDLLLSDVFEMDEFSRVLVLVVVETRGSGGAGLGEETVGARDAAAVSCRGRRAGCHTLSFVLKVLQFLENFHKLFLPLIFDISCLNNSD